MSTYTEGSSRPYANKAEFDRIYPVSYKPYVGIIDNGTGQPISSGIPMLTNAGDRRALGIRHVRPLSTGYKKNPYSDLEMSEYFDWSNLKQLLASLFKSLVRNYSKMLISQPFEVAKNLLQVGSFRKEPSVVEDDDEEPRYFEGQPTGRRSSIERTPQTTAVQVVAPVIKPASTNMLDVVSALVGREGPRGAFKAINTSFLIYMLQYTLQSWICGFVSGLLGIPDPLFVEISHSPNPGMSLVLSMGSSIATSVVLSTLCLIRMRFIVTTSTRGTRSFRENVSNLPRFSLFKVPRELLVPSIVSNSISAFARYYPDYFLTVILQISKYNQPYVYNSISMVLRILGMFIRLPFETLYSRAQVNALLTSTNLAPALHVDSEDLCVNFAGYWGYISTPYYIVAGTRPVECDGVNVEVTDKYEMNNGISAIFRGWKVGLIQTVSRFTLKLIANESDYGSSRL